MQTNRHASIQLTKIFRRLEFSCCVTQFEFTALGRVANARNSTWRGIGCVVLRRIRFAETTSGSNSWPGFAALPDPVGKWPNNFNSMPFRARTRPFLKCDDMRQFFLRKHLWRVVLVSSCPALCGLVAGGQAICTAFPRTLAVVVCKSAPCLATTVVIDSNGQKEKNKGPCGHDLWNDPRQMAHCQDLAWKTISLGFFSESTFILPQLRF